LSAAPKGSEDVELSIETEMRGNAEERNGVERGLTDDER